LIREPPDDTPGAPGGVRFLPGGPPNRTRLPPLCWPHVPTSARRADGASRRGRGRATARPPNDQTGQIIDLKEEKVYDLDIRKKQYKVTTFAEIRRRMEEAMKNAEESAKDNKAEAPPEQTGKEVEVDFDVKDTGQRKAINGFDTHQVIMTIAIREKGRTLEESGGIVLTTDMWLTPRVAAMSEIAEFDIRYATQLAGPMIAGASAEEWRRPWPCIRTEGRDGARAGQKARRWTARPSRRR
jgi:hypothetical protein